MSSASEGSGLMLNRRSAFAVGLVRAGGTDRRVLSHHDSIQGYALVYQ